MEQSYALLRSPEAAAFDLKLSRRTYSTPTTRAALVSAVFSRGGSRDPVRDSSKSRGVHPVRILGHTQGRPRAPAKLKQQIDRPVSPPRPRPRRRGLLDRTLIVLASEFSRDAMLEGAADNPAEQGSDLQALPDIVNESETLRHASPFHRRGLGADVWRRREAWLYVHGKTADERPCKAIENPVSIADLHQTIHHALGIAPDTHYEIEGRPFYTTPDGKGAAVKEILA
jgi:hypothetical protein